MKCIVIIPNQSGIIPNQSGAMLLFLTNKVPCYYS